MRHGIIVKPRSITRRAITTKRHITRTPLMATTATQCTTRQKPRSRTPSITDTNNERGSRGIVPLAEPRRAQPVVDVNIKGTANTIRHFVPAMIEKKRGIINTDMLRIGFGDSASLYPDPKEWFESAIPFLLELGPKDNG